MMGVDCRQRVVLGLAMGLDEGCFGVVLDVRCFRGLLEGSGAERCGRQWQRDSWAAGVPNGDQRAHLTVTEYPIPLSFSLTHLCVYCI